MADQWVILELSPKAEGEDPDLVRRSITYAVKGADVFIPAVVTQQGEDRAVHYLVEGYAFIRHQHPEAAYSRLENSKYVQSVLTKVVRMNGSRSMRQLAFISDADVEKMKRQIKAETDQGISIGDTVLITSGAYRQITAKVIEEIVEEQKVQVHIQLRSKDSIITLPRSFLRLVQKAPKPVWYDRFHETKEWFNDAMPVLRWNRSSNTLSETLTKFETLSTWVYEIQTFTRAHEATTAPLAVETLVEKQALVTGLTRWSDALETGSALVRSFYTPLDALGQIKQTFDRWYGLQQIQARLDALKAEVAAMEQQASSDENGQAMTVKNVIVDGLNLACRVMYAPGMAELRDMKNRPSGVIYGFLRSITSLAKRFPDARIWVAWDGSNRARKAKFADYKANRVHTPAEPGAWDQVAWLRETLPYLGITQAYNVEEEADDVIASLVRGPFRGQRNVILSSDRDLLQLVSETDNLLTPAQGKRKETLYDVSALKDEWGVEPTQIVTLRALLGDTSDNLPGVPTVPEKVLVELVNLYGTLDGIFGSNLAGLTKLRYERLRSSEKQARLNYEIMSLRDVAFTEVPANPDQKTAVERLTDVDVQVEPLLTVFFGENTAGVGR